MINTYFDQPLFNQNNIFFPFAITDVLLEDSSEKQLSFLHFWQYEKTFILGMKDTRVTNLPKGIQSIWDNHYFPVIRNSGGLGVISDTGVLNISLIFPKEEMTTTDTAYEKMYELTQQAFPELEISAYEISDSYCPGTYDLSVAGKKIAGIAQRRVKNGVAVMMYLSVNGDQHARGQAVREFYQASLTDDFGKNGYPAVNPDSMTTLENLLDYPISIEETKERFLQILNISNPASNAIQWIQENNYQPLFEKKIASMQQRNLQIGD